MNLAGAVQDVVDRLVAGGVRAVLDERDLNPPAVYVAPPAVAWRFGHGDFDATFTIWCVTGSAGRSVDLVNLGDTARGPPADLLIPHQAAPLPAYRLTWAERIRQPRAQPKE
jgi:hypothetical protein